MDETHFHCDSRCTEYSLLFTVVDCKLVNIKVCFLFCDQLRDSMNISATVIVFRDKNKKELDLLLHSSTVLRIFW